MAKGKRLSSKQKGNVSENRIVELITLGSQGKLTCYRPDADDDGLDLIVNERENFRPIFLQVKGRFVLNNRQFVQNVGVETFKPDKRFYLAFVLFTQERFEVHRVWLVPSRDFAVKANRKESGKTYKAFFRFSANPNSSEDKWAEYQLHPASLGSRIVEIIKSVYESGDGRRNR
jgi:hypothetical protein